jgi:hypothetical protein
MQSPYNYCHITSSACHGAGKAAIPAVSYLLDRAIHGWKEYVCTLKEQSLFLHHLWMEAGRPNKGGFGIYYARH